MPLKPVRLRSKSLPRIAAQTRTHRHAIFPSPTKGLDVGRPLVSQDPETAVTLNNWWCRKWGPELRHGFSRWTSNLGGGVRTLMPFQAPSSSTGLIEPRFFAACDDNNIYQITLETDEISVPGVAQSIPGQITSGRFSFINVNIAGVHYLAMVSAGGGYWTYSEAAGWVDRTASITGTNALEFDFITQWKGRIWFIRANTTEAWYLPIDSIQGAVSKFDFGIFLNHGGALEVIASWTVDAGEGIDDKFVVIGSEGDVLIYEGTDPTSATTFALAGRWFVGRTPIGRRFVSKWGGDLAIVTEHGIEYLSKLQQGLGLLDPSSARDDPWRRFNEEIGEEVKRTRGQSFWSILFHPGEEASLIITPRAVLTDALQFVQTTLPRAWSTFTGLPMRCVGIFQGELYFGDDDGRVHLCGHADTDGELSDGTPGSTIAGIIQTAYVSDSSDPMSLKRPLLLCPMFQSSAAPSVIAQVNTEWSTIGAAGIPAFSPSGASLWDSSLWDTAVWSEENQAYIAWLGAAGLGAYMSLRMTVAGMPGTIFTSWKLVYEPGGIM